MRGMHAATQPVGTEDMHEQVDDREGDRGGFLHAREPPERPLAVGLLHAHAALERQVRHRMRARVLLALIRARPTRQVQHERAQVALPPLLAVRQASSIHFARHHWNSSGWSPDEASVNGPGPGPELVAMVGIMTKLSGIRCALEKWDGTDQDVKKKGGDWREGVRDWSRHKRKRASEESSLSGDSRGQDGSGHAKKARK